MTETYALKAARISPHGEGAITVFRLRGDAAGDALTRLFRPHGVRELGVEDLRVGTLLIGTNVEESAVVRTNGNGKITEVDVSIHGGHWLADRFHDCLRELGAEPLDPDDGFGLYDPVIAGPAIYREAQASLVQAFAESQLSFFLTVLGGGFARTLRSLAASIRAAEGSAATPPALVGRLDSLLNRAPLGRALASPPKVAITGVPNAGKSTLFNALLGRDRAIVAPIAGTTRDLLEEPLSILGFPFVVHDSAGVRDTADPVEAAGVRRASAAAAAADVRLLAIDLTAPFAAQDALLETADRRSTVVVLTKSDLAPAAELLSCLGQRGFRVVAWSPAAGPHELNRLRSLLVAGSVFSRPTIARQVSPFTDRQVSALREARTHLAGGTADGRRDAVRAVEKALDGER